MLTLIRLPAVARTLVFALLAFCMGSNMALSAAIARTSTKSPAAKGKSSEARARRKTGRASQRSQTPASTQTATSPTSTLAGEPFVILTAAATQQPTPRQSDATRPPGTEQKQTVPPDARTRPSDPTAPPGTQRTSPQAPPGTNVPADPRTTTPQTSPTTQPTPISPTEAQDAIPSADQDVTEPNFPVSQPRPVPPRPSLARVGVLSGDTLTLALNDAIRRSLENNNTIEIARHDVRLAEASLNSLQGIYDPIFSYSPQYDKSIRPVTNIFGGASQSGTVSTTDYNNDFLLTKQFGRGGGNLSYFFNNTRETTSASNLTLNPFHSAAQGITFTQPLWRNRSIDRTRREIRIQQKRLEQSDADFRRSTIEIISQVQRAYWDLVFALRDEQNQIANLDLARENFRRTEASVAAGAAAPLERAEIQTELSLRESSLLLASQNVTVAENQLKTLMLKDPLAPEWSRAIVPTDQPTFDDTPVNLEAALKEARTNRPEMRRLTLQNDINEIDRTFFKNQTKPRIDFTGTFQTNGLAGARGTTFDELGNSVPIPDCSPSLDPQQRCIPKNFVGGYGQALRNLFSLDTRQIVFGVRLEFPFRNRTAEANLAFAKIEQEQIAARTRVQDQSIEVEVRNAVQAVETSRRRVLSARQARLSAEEQLAGERRLYQVGRSTTFILFQRENTLVNARNSELRAETDYNKALADLQRATSTTLRVNNVVIESPYAPGK